VDVRRRLSLSENAVQLGVNHAVGPTKGRKARSVPVPAFVLDELSMQCRGKAPTDLVFAGPDGNYLPRPKSADGWFAAAVRKAGVQDITPHDLRHTCASLGVSAGVNVLALQRMEVTRKKVCPKCAHGAVGVLASKRQKCRLPAQTPLELWRWRRDLNTPPLSGGCSY
jgi:hypothetical protein